MARYDGSTALAFSMHSHLLETLKFRYRHNLTPSFEPPLRRVAAEELVLISSGGSDWIEGSGTLVKEEGGYRFNAKKVFGSGGPAADLLLTTGVYDDPENGPSVLHFGVNLRGEGIKIQDDWHTLGMCGTGSNTIEIENVFVPDGGVTLTRPQGVWHRFFDIISPMAFALITSAYVGVAECARDIAISQASKKKDDPLVQSAIGEMETELLAAQNAWDSMVELGASDFEPSVQNSDLTFRLKTIANRSAIRTVEKAIEATGGAAYFRRLGLERCFRDIQASRFHPLQEARQHVFSGRLALGLDPIG